MKKIFLSFAFVFLLFPVICQETNLFETSTSEDKDDTNIEINEKTGFPKIKAKPFVMFNEGFAVAQVTRIQTVSGRSNFVWQNDFIGAFFQIQTRNMKPLNSVIRTSVFYPFYNTFNDVKQFPKQTVLYAFDLFAGPILETDMWKYVRLKFGLGLHYMYQLSDEYHLHYLGGGALAGLELPIEPRWSILLDGTFSLDYPNFGTNSLVQPYDYSWQYQLNLGVRYSVKGKNRYSYIRQSEKSLQKEALKAENKAKRKELKAQRRAEKKAAKAEVKAQRDKEKILKAESAATESTENETFANIDSKRERK